MNEGGRNSRRITKPREPLRKRRQKIPESAAPHRLNPAPSGAWFDFPDPSPIRGRHDGGLWSALALEHREVNGFLGTCEQTAAMALSIEHDPPTAIVLADERTWRSRGDPQLLFRLPHHSLQTTGDGAQLSPVPRGLGDRRFCLRLREFASPRRVNGSADGRRDRRQPETNCDENRRAHSKEQLRRLRIAPASIAASSSRGSTILGLV